MDIEKENFFRDLLLKNHKKKGNCLEWMGKTNQGYGYIYIFKKTWAIHRISYEIENGCIPDGLYVLHTCNNKKCFNPRHLYAGTAKENTEDLLNSDYYDDVREKISEERKKGEEYRNSQLPSQEFYSVEDLAKIFDVHPYTIRRAIRKGHLVAIRIGNGKKSPYRISKKSIDQIHFALLKEMAKKVEK